MGPDPDGPFGAPAQLRLHACSLSGACDQALRLSGPWPQCKLFAYCFHSVLSKPVSLTLWGLCGRTQIETRVEQMHSLQAELELYPMQLDEDFDYEPFWGKLLAIAAEEADEASLAELPNRLQVLILC